MAKVITENFKVETTNELYKSFKNENSNLSDSFIEQLKVYDASSSTLTLDENADIPEIKKLVDGQLELLRPESNYYIMASTTLTSTAGIPSVADTQKQKRDFQRKIIFGNKVSDSSARYMFFENEWKTGTIYDAFDDTVDLATKNTIVTVQTTEGEYLAFKCLENNGGAPSTINPQEEIAQFVSSNFMNQFHYKKQKFKFPPIGVLLYLVSTPFKILASLLLNLGRLTVFFDMIKFHKT